MIDGLQLSRPLDRWGGNPRTTDSRVFLKYSKRTRGQPHQNRTMPCRYWEMQCLLYTSQWSFGCFETHPRRVLMHSLVSPQERLKKQHGCSRCTVAYHPWHRPTRSGILPRPFSHHPSRRHLSSDLRCPSGSLCSVEDLPCPTPGISLTRFCHNTAAQRVCLFLFLLNFTPIWHRVCLGNFMACPSGGNGHPSPGRGLLLG